MVYRNNPCGQYASPLNVIDRVAARHSVSVIFQLCFEEMQILHNSGYVAEVGILHCIRCHSRFEVLPP